MQHLHAERRHGSDYSLSDLGLYQQRQSRGCVVVMNLTRNLTITFSEVKHCLLQRILKQCRSER